MSSPAPEAQEARPEDAMQQDEPQEDRYDVTGPEGGDGQPEVRGDQSQPVNNKGPALMDIVCYSSLLSSVALYWSPESLSSVEMIQNWVIYPIQIMRNKVSLYSPSTLSALHELICTSLTDRDASPAAARRQSRSPSAARSNRSPSPRSPSPAGQDDQDASGADDYRDDRDESVKKLGKIKKKKRDDGEEQETRVWVIW